MERLADFDHPLVQTTATKLTVGVSEPRDKLERIFLFVRDRILFGFPPEGDFVKASETIKRGYGQCNTKGILFLSLCKAAGIPARIHYSRISKNIQRGFFTGIIYWLMPDEISHSWLEVEIDGKWHPVDTYINDLRLHREAVRELQRRVWETGFSVSRADGEPSADLVLDEAHYSQMAAVIGDHGIWDEPAQYLNGSEYLNRVGPIRQWLYRLFLPMINRRVRRLRESEHPIG
jgi:transglutaminase-like putative cysteine protease